MEFKVLRMKLIKVDPENLEKEKLALIRDTLRNGGTVVYPTDTVYGLGASIFQEEAIFKVYHMKERSLNKPVSICLSSIDDIKKIAYLDQVGEELIQKILPGPYTLILNKKDKVPSLLTAGMDKIGVRMPDNIICQELSREFPITTTSANISGNPSPKSAREAQRDLGDQPDIIIDSGPCRGGTSSTVVDLTVTPPQIRRKGAGMEKLIQILES